MQTLDGREFVLYFVRHAQTDANAVPDIIGGKDADLTPEGVEQAQKLGQFLAAADFKPHEVYCSDMVRAKHTTDILCEALPFSRYAIREDARLREINQGEWDGGSRAELHTPSIHQRMALESMDFHAPSGESVNDVAARMRGWLLDTAFTRPIWPARRTFLIVSHGVAIKALMQRLFTIEESRVWLINMDNTGITKIRHHPQHGWILDYHNRTPHLPSL